jgi:hypothetical protein
MSEIDDDGGGKGKIALRRLEREGRWIIYEWKVDESSNSSRAS